MRPIEWCPSVVDLEAAGEAQSAKAVLHERENAVSGVYVRVCGLRVCACMWLVWCMCMYVVSACMWLVGCMVYVRACMFVKRSREKRGREMQTTCGDVLLCLF